MSDSRHSFAFVGGTGPEGLGLAMRFAMAGHEVIIGSRRLERAQEAAEKVLAKVPTATVRGLENQAAVEASEYVVITVPYSGQKDTLEGLRAAIGDKIVIDTVVPLEFDKGKITALIVEEGSASQQAQAALPEARVIGAFQNLSAKELMAIEHPVPADVVVCGDHADAKKAVMEIAESIEGVRAIDGGALANARYVEDITALLANINKIYKAHSSIKIVGV